MGIHPIGYALISGQKNSGEIVVSASTLMSTSHQFATPISAEKSVRIELLSALENYIKIDQVHNSQPAREYVNSLVEPDNKTCTNHHLCLALDLEGYKIARDIFLANGNNPDEKVHDFVCKLNILDRRVPPPPTSTISIDYLLKVKNCLYWLSEDYDKLQTREPFSSFVARRMPMVAIEQEYYFWFRTLYEYVLPWKNIIGKIQWAWS